MSSDITCRTLVLNQVLNPGTAQGRMKTPVLFQLTEVSGTHEL